MKKLSEVAFSELQVNDRVQSDNTKRYGKITALIHRDHAKRQEDHEVVITWDTHPDEEKEIPNSRAWLFWLDKVTYLGRAAT